MKNWKRNGKDLNSIVLEDLGENYKAWWEFFETDTATAFSLFDEKNFCRVNDISTLIKIYNSVKNNEKCDLNKKNRLRQTIFEKAKFSHNENEQNEIERFFDSGELEQMDWYLDKLCRKHSKKLNIYTWIITFSLIAAAYILNLFWNGGNYFSKSSIIILSLSAISLLCIAIETYIQSRIIGAALLMSSAIAIGTNGYLAGIFALPDASLWFIFISIWTAVCFILLKLQWKKKPSPASWYANLSKICLYLMPFMGTCLIVALSFAESSENNNSFISIFSADNLKLANTCHNWNWHKRELDFITAWRNEPQGMYANLNSELRKDSIWEPVDLEKINKAYDNIASNDPDRQCGNKTRIAPWKNEFKTWLSTKCLNAIKGKKNKNSYQLICEYMNFYRSKFAEQPVPGDIVFRELFYPEIKNNERDDLELVRKLMDEFVESNSNSNSKKEALKYAIEPALNDLFKKINQTDPLQSSPRNDDLHIKFKYLESVCKKYAENEKISVLEEYENFTAARNAKISETVKTAADKYINRADSSDWIKCKSAWLEEFSNRIPAACFVLWKYGHPEIKDALKNNKWLRYLEIDQAGKIAESSYYAAEIHAESKFNTKALKFYRRALKSCNDKKSHWIIRTRHQIAELTADENEKWLSLWKIYESNDLTSQEYITFARMCVERKKNSEALDVYNKCNDNDLNIKDLFTIVKLNVNPQDKINAFGKLADKIENIMSNGNVDDNILENFHKLGKKINATEQTHDLLCKAVVKGNIFANQLYVDIIKTYHRKLEENAVKKLIADEKTDKEVINLARITNDDNLYIREAARWAERKYENYQEHLLEAGKIAFRKDLNTRARELWSKLDYEKIDQVREDYISLLDKEDILNEKDIQYLASRSVLHKDVERLIRLAENFEINNEYCRAVYFWDKVCKFSSESIKKGRAYYKLFTCADPDKTSAAYSTKYPMFDEEAEKIYNEMKKSENRKYNLFKAVFEHHNKNAVLFLGDLWYSAFVNDPFYPPKERVDDLKKAFRKILQDNPSEEEQNDLNRYLVANDPRN